MKLLLRFGLSGTLAWRSCSAFSLTELLVTLAIVVVLAVLSIGGIRSLQSSSGSAQCLSNLRQLGVGALAYIQDRNGLLFQDKIFYAASFEAGGGFRDYVGYNFPERTSRAPAHFSADSLFTCPELKRQVPEKFQPPTLFNRAYTMNEYALASEDGIAKPASYPGRFSRIPAPSEMVFLMDGSALSSGSTFHTTLNPSYVTRNFLFYPHRKSQNILFFDGHVAAVPEADIRRPRNPRNFWGNLDLPES